MSAVDSLDTSLAELTAAIVELCAPRRVILFGSRARGDHRPDSDYDIFVVADSDAERLRESLRDRYRVDVLVDTPERFDRRRDDVGTMEYVVEREGRVLYDRDPAPSVSRVLEGSGQPPESFHEWMNRAAADYQMMELAADKVPDGACFHAHRSAEKFLKAALVFNETPPPRTHSLSELLRMSSPELRTNPSVRDACGVLDSVYDKSRYPHKPMPTSDEVSACVAAAGRVRGATAAYTNTLPGK
ncbi:MAG: uncharacterized protein JWM41_3835 [Gemmatimonadetes bacterium]|nr:uncharacterized protein [Gemmatimonadota bacterium]